MALAIARGHTVPVRPEGTRLVGVVRTVELHRLLSDVLLFAGKDDTLPMLTVIHIETDGKRMIACATDRFAFGIGKLAIPHGDQVDVQPDRERNEFNLQRCDVEILLKLCKTTQYARSFREVAIGLNDDSSIVFSFTDGVQIRFQTSNAAFPNWRHLLPESGTEIARAATGINGTYLGRLAKVSGPGFGDRCMRVFSFDAFHASSDRGEKGMQKPLAVTIGDDFIALIMPIRLPDSEWTFKRPEWVA